VNLARIRAGKSAANAIWLWGQGFSPDMPGLYERYGINGVVISAVDLLKGLGICAGLDSITVPGATGYLDTNYAGKVAATLEALRQSDFVYLHVEAPDEASHEGNLELKIEAIEAFDSQVVGPLLQGCGELERVRMMLITDHFTPVRLRTHARGLVPFAICDLPVDPGVASRGYSEKSAAETGLIVKPGHTLMASFTGTRKSGPVGQVKV
jgi:2,3-bisphosphoglycerate-independent phosphoglycerate mutase